MESYLGGQYSAVRQKHTSIFGVYLLLSITSVCKLFSMSVHRSVQEFDFYRISRYSAGFSPHHTLEA